MLSDEEKREYEELKSLLYTGTISQYGKRKLIDIFEKQSKEIEELKNITKSYDSFLGTEKIVIADKKFFVNGYFRENYVSKDKIKAKIEELKDGTFDAKIVLQSLLEKE